MTYSALSFASSSGQGKVLTDEQVVKLVDDFDDASVSSNYSYYDDDLSYDDDSSDSSWDEDMDELMDWFNDTIVSPEMRPQLRRIVSMPAIRTSPKPKLHGSLGGKSSSSIILNRLVNCNAEYLQPPTSTEKTRSTTSSNPESPVDCIREIFARRGLDCSDVKAPESLFLKVTQEHIDAYSLETTMAARAGNLPYLKGCLRKGESLQCCNRHGESIVHIVCRRGSDKILNFLIEKAGVKVMVKDDVGRTPLHDAAWTDSPNFDLVKVLLKTEPRMMYVKDNRNHTPLSYVPRQKWELWCNFLKENEELLFKALEL